MTEIDILDIDHVEFIVAGVKISFYANPNRSPLKTEIIYLNNLKLADLIEYIGEWEMLYNPDFNCTEFGTIKNAK